MKMVDARWSRRVNMLTIQCDCGARFDHPANRRIMQCPKCRRTASVETVR